MAKVKDTDYIFLSAYLRAKETKMLSREMLDNLLTDGSFADAARTLSECGYADMSDMNSQQVEKALTEYRNAQLQDVAETAAQKELVDLFRLPYDYHNAKVLVKTVGREEGLLSSAGRISIEELTEAFRSGDFSVLPEPLAKAIAEANEVLATTQNPQRSDMVLDAAYYAEMLALARPLGDDFVTGYVRLQIDSANLRCFVRARRMGRDADFFAEALIPGGEITAEKLAERFAEGEGPAGIYSGTLLKEAAAIGEAAARDGRLTQFELAADNAVVDYLAGAGSIAFGVGPVLAYLSALESQTTALRMILTGWLMNIPAQTIRERLRDNNA